MTESLEVFEEEAEEAEEELLVPRLKSRDICEITTWSRWTLARRVKEKKFPPPERIGDSKELTWRVPVVKKFLQDNVRPAGSAGTA